MVSSLPAQPGLLDAVNAARSPATIRGILENSASLKQAGLSIEGCALRKVRPKKDGTVELEYRCTFRKLRGHGRFAAAILGKLYPDDKGEQEHRKLLRRSVGRGLPTVDAGLEDLVLYVPGLRLLLHSTSSDEGVSGLRVALDADAMRAVLERSLEATAHGEERLRRCEVDVLRYRPGHRCTLRYRLEMLGLGGERIQSRRVIGKLYGAREEARRAWGIMLELERRGFGRDAADGITVPRPEGWVDDLNMVLMEEVGDPTLRERLSSPSVVEDLRVAGRALAKLQASRLELAGQYGVDDELASTERWVTKATRIEPGLVGALRAALGHVAESAADLTRHEPVLIHGDFHYTQLLAGKRRMTIVDFDTICNGDPAKDAGNFLSHLTCKGIELGWTGHQTRSHGEAFLAAYRRSIAPELMGRLHFYYRTSLLRLVCLVSLRPKKRHLTGVFLAEVGKTPPFS